ncbi:MAG: 4-hydroxythreonine-4-phosphate dehydrogenase PdxA [Planctomycetaceae bacterium]|nr:4-hydroxythreonine-4-phosphate dehydrogenase PdxA [Planctomycetaceae bacterium]
MKQPVIAITLGDVCGIGPEIVARAVTSSDVRGACRPLIIGSADIIQQAAQLRQLPDVNLFPVDSPAAMRHVPAEATAVLDPWPDGPPLPTTAQVEVVAGEAAWRYLLAAIDLAQQGAVEAIATAPLNKAALHAAGHDYPGHTEILAAQCDVNDFAMMLHLCEQRIAPLRQLVAPHRTHQPRSGLSIAHVTLHTSIASVPGLLTADAVSEKIALMDGFLQDLKAPRRSIAVCALNPHGGEQGLFGDEEQTIITPAVESARANMDVHGPLPVDTLMRRAVAGEFDGIVAMYHDQGHIPIKMIGFDAAVNITLGLPIVRTSPTHGTAFDRAWQADTPADASGMQEAILTAAALAQGRGRAV